MEKNLEIFLRIYISHHTLKSFLYDRLITLYKSLSKRRGVNQIYEKGDEVTLIDHILNISKDSDAHTDGIGSIMNILHLPQL